MRYLIVLLSAVALMGTVGLAGAHQFGPNGEGNPYYAIAIPDELIPTFDGDLSDWAWFPSEYTFTPDDFVAMGNFTEAEADVPKDDFDVIIYGPAWIPTMNMMTFAVRKVDDILYAPNEEIQMAWTEDAVQFATDADHAGDPKAENTEYQQNFFTPKQGGHVGLFGQEELWWEFQEPYCYWGATIDEATGTFDVEIAITMWDHLDPTGPDASTLHTLEAHQIIGFSVEVHDADSDTEIEFPDVEFDFGNIAVGGEVLPDYYLLPVEETYALITAVESNTWGRIKSTFVK